MKEITDATGRTANNIWVDLQDRVDKSILVNYTDIVVWIDEYAVIKAERDEMRNALITIYSTLRATQDECYWKPIKDIIDRGSK
jgi:hypothetical protein